MNCTFRSTTSNELGTVISTSNMRSSMNYLQLINNTFENNNCLKHGGLFSFSTVKYTVTSIGNIYLNNRAKGSGGIGYLYISELWYSEKNGVYKSRK